MAVAAVAAVVLNWVESEIRQTPLQGTRDLIERVERLISHYHRSGATEQERVSLEGVRRVAQCIISHREAAAA